MKKYILKALSICAVGLLIITQSACSDLLDQEPQGQWTDNDKPGGSFETEVFTLYAKVRGWGVASGTPALAVHNYRSEDVEKGSTVSDGELDGKMYDDFDYIKTNGLIKTYWEDTYSMIHVANGVIADVKKYEEDGNVLTKNDSINNAEAHFFRAFGYFNLVRAFGEVPLIDFKIEENSLEGNIAKSPAVKIYELIDSDLTIAAKSLPLRWEAKFIGRLTWGAARSLHARTYMMRSDWNNMYTASTDVVNSGIYNLNTPFDQIFRETGENCSESIFEIQCTATESLPGHNEVGSQYAQAQGVRGAGDWNLGWGMHTPSQILADAFEVNDPRKDETLLYFVKSNEDPNSIPANKPYGERPIAEPGVINKYYNKKVYTDPTLRRKYNKYGYWVNIRMIRLSDVILMAAESAVESGKTQEAINNLELVRARARGANASILPKVTSADPTALKNAIRQERRVELAMEWDRFYDLVRWGTAAQVLHAAGKTNYQPKHALLPIPQTAIDKSNGVLIQNPNY